MNIPILFQSLSRIAGKERRSKLLHNESELYALLHQVKTRIAKRYEVGEDRMDLHIEMTKNPDDSELEAKTKTLQGQNIALTLPENWGYLHRAFVLWTPEVADYGKTHITIAFFGDKPKPELIVLQELVLQVLKENEK
jgi:hypothetical protein